MGWRLPPTPFYYVTSPVAAARPNLTQKCRLCFDTSPDLPQHSVNRLLMLLATEPQTSRIYALCCSVAELLKALPTPWRKHRVLAGPCVQHHLEQLVAPYMTV